MAPGWTEELMAKAMQDVLDGKSIHKAAVDLKIPYSSLRARLQGGRPRRFSKSEHQYLTEAQEASLSNLVLSLSKQGRPPSAASILSLASVINNGITDEIGNQHGEKWVSCFLQRHPDVKLALSQADHEVQAAEGTHEDMEAHISALADKVRDYQIPTQYWAAVDVTSIANGSCSGSDNSEGVVEFVSGFRATRALSRSSHAHSRDWMTVIHCACPDGRVLTPAVIKKGQPTQYYFAREDTEAMHRDDHECDPGAQEAEQAPQRSWLHAVSKRGLCTTMHFREWFHGVFLQELPAPEGQWRLLILDMLTPHTDEKFIREAIDNKVLLYFLPVESPHITHPLDIGIFEPLRRFFLQAVAALSDDSISCDGAVDANELLAMVFEESHASAVTTEKVRAGWTAAGLVPLSAETLISQLDTVTDSEGDDESPHQTDRQRTPLSPPFLAVFKTPQTLDEFNALMHASFASEAENRLRDYKLNKAYDQMYGEAARNFDHKTEPHSRKRWRSEDEDED